MNGIYRALSLLSGAGVGEQDDQKRMGAFVVETVERQ
jgi:hypothetical protein